MINELIDRILSCNTRKEMAEVLDIADDYPFSDSELSDFEDAFKINLLLLRGPDLKIVN